MSFPNKKGFWKVKDGWEDLGKIGTYYDERTGKSMILLHPICLTRLRIGKESGKYFRYCPLCFEKTK